MTFPLVLQSYSIGDIIQEIYIPDPQFIQQFYNNRKEDAYWSKVWPASLALCSFLQQHPQYIANKKVLELAAGLGLPGIYAAQLAKEVIITDKEKHATAIVQQSVNHLNLSNIIATTLNWKNLAKAPPHQVLLLSDVNYEPTLFDELLEVLQHSLHRNMLIILSTPQRLVAKRFIANLLPYIIYQQPYSASKVSSDTDISVFVLEKRK